jgi:outer membrane protein assembly factor BamB
MKNLVTFIFLVTAPVFYSQTSLWESFVDSIPTLSSPRSADLNNDGVKDIVIGGGTDGAQSNSGVMAFDGNNGALLWKAPSRNEVFGSPLFIDITNDGIEDVFITGREAQFLAFDGSDGTLLWDFFSLCNQSGR